MLIGFLVAGIIIYLFVSAHFKKYREADEKTLRPMSEWVILANSGTRNHREKMAYSLIVQAEAILEQQKILGAKSLRNLMISNKGISKSNFVLFLLEAPSTLCPNEFDFLKNSYNGAQARAHLATCIGLILHYGGGELALVQLAQAATLTDPID
ncbi:hypothetical protein ACG916_21350 [Acinetobacter sp. ULE_I024]|uniref:hypothetical protein n=1 Tax=unclassified Acinetobacter TaxID=196816 RepID=UPI003AF74B3E